MDEEKIRAWTSQELITEVYRYLNQKSALALSFMEVLTDESNYGFVNDQQKEFLKRLQKEIEYIRRICELMEVWVAGRRDEG